MFAISTHGGFLLFWYTGTGARLCDHSRPRQGIRKPFTTSCPFGWTGSKALAALRKPVAGARHYGYAAGAFRSTIVSLTSPPLVIPGWHTNHLSALLRCGRYLLGFAMVQTLMVMTRKILKLEEYITLAHIESMNKGDSGNRHHCGVAYLTELFIAWYSGYIYEQFAFYNRVMYRTGPT